MNSFGAAMGPILKHGTVRAALVLLAFVVFWAVRQLGGLNLYLVNSWLLLSLPLVIAAIGVTLVIFTGQFDLSAAGVVTLVNVSMATWLGDLPAWAAVLVALALGAAIGAFNGLLVVKAKLPAIAVTLAVLIALNGLALVVLPTPGGLIQPELVEALTGQAVIPRSIIVIAILVVLWLVYRRSRLGIYAFAAGQDDEALRLSGVSVARVRITIFAIAGLLYGVAGVFLSAAIQTGDATIGTTYLLQTFAAIAIGGTAFIGGSGSAIGTILGALTLTVIPKVLFVVGISGWVQQIFTGVLIILAVLVGAISARTEGRKRQTLVRDDHDGTDAALVQGGTP